MLKSSPPLDREKLSIWLRDIGRGGHFFLTLNTTQATTTMTAATRKKIVGPFISAAPFCFLSEILMLI